MKTMSGSKSAQMTDAVKMPMKPGLRKQSAEDTHKSAMLQRQAVKGVP